MEKEYLTVKEYATLKNCSTQYVYRLLQTKLQPYVMMVEGRKCLKISVLDEVVANQVANNSTKVANKKLANSETSEEKTFQNSKFSSSAEDEISQFAQWQQGVIDDLREEIKNKDATIQKQSDQIVELSNKITELFENNQKLQLNYQLLLGNSGEQQYNIDDEAENVQGAPVQEETIEEPKKKGLFSRLFK